MLKQVLFFLLFFLAFEIVIAQSTSQLDPRISAIAKAPSAKRIETDIRKLVSFGTRNTLSDTVSQTRGIGAARRWIKAEFDKISKDCNNCLEVIYQGSVVKGDPNGRIKTDTWVVNVLAIQRGSRNPNRYVIMSGDIDSRVSDPSDAIKDSPGANDNGSGMAGVIEAARVLSKYQFPNTIIYTGLSAEEQGLNGGQYMAKVALEQNWEIIGVLNNDMIGNIEGVNGVIDNTTFRVFSEPTSMTETEQQRAWHRVYGGEVDGPSRQLARYVDKMTDLYMTNLDAKMIYRLDRFGRGGHHKPFNDLGFTGIRIMETNENYTRQHQDLRTEDGIKYGDVIEGVNFDYAAKLTGVNAIVLAGLAWAPPAPSGVMIGGAVQPSTRLQWDAVNDSDLIGYRIYWRETTDAQWKFSHFVDKSATNHILENVVIDNYLFGVASVGKDGNESVVTYPVTLIPARRRN